jgi:NDP-hexose 5-epimerase
VKLTELAVADAYRIVPEPLTDVRGSFREAFRQTELEEAMGRRFPVAQINYSVSHRGVLRGIHGARVPPGLGKVVTCVRGAVLDVVVDLRVGSPTFGEHALTLQDANDGIAVVIPEGLGHAFLALAEGTTMCYLCSDEYDPSIVIDVNPLDPELKLPWGLSGTPVMSEKDAGAPTLAQAAELGILPSYRDCQALYESRVAVI